MKAALPPSRTGFDRPATYEDLVKAGVIDPAKVTRLALQNAASIAGLILTTDCMIANAPRRKPEAGSAAQDARSRPRRWRR